jgi:hypothetical protein
MHKRSHSRKKKRINFAALSKKKLIKFIKNLTRRTSKRLRKFGKQKGG